MTKTIKQISLFAENKTGRLLKVAEVLGREGINIRAFTIAESGDFGIIRLIVDKPDLAHIAFKKEGFTVSETDLIGIEIDDTPGALRDIASLFSKGNINIEYSYAFIGRNQKAILIIRVSDLENVFTYLKDKGIHLLEIGDLL
ncbi:MAG: ACT domain-containing protein [Methanimicrococcus sp.]|nr:ACT domain-containing protein [Methanimicrococcus sp.]